MRVFIDIPMLLHEKVKEKNNNFCSFRRTCQESCHQHSFYGLLHDQEFRVMLSKQRNQIDEMEGALIANFLIRSAGHRSVGKWQRTYSNDQAS